MRESWTDERLDDLRDGLADFRTETRTEFKALRAEMRDEFATVRTEMREEFAAVRAEVRAETASGFGQMNQRFDRLFQMMIGFGGLTVASLIGFIATQG